LIITRFGRIETKLSRIETKLSRIETKLQQARQSARSDESAKSDTKSVRFGRFGSRQIGYNTGGGLDHSLKAIVPQKAGKRARKNNFYFFVQA
jgi:hypothetical protein